MSDIDREQRMDALERAIDANHDAIEKWLTRPYLDVRPGRDIPEWVTENECGVRGYWRFDNPRQR